MNTSDFLKERIRHSIKLSTVFMKVLNEAIKTEIKAM